MGRMGLGFLLCALACTSVRMVQRDGCWLKQTETTLGGSREELGFCAKPEPAPVDDRMSRLVQECMAQADYRWQNRAIAAWGRHEPIPSQDTDDATARTCMGQASAALGIEAENSALRSRLAELSQDRESLKMTAEEDRDFLQKSSDKLVTALGEAAKKPAPNATATATSTGTAKSDTPAQAAPTLTIVTRPAPLVAQPLVVVNTPAAMNTPVQMMPAPRRAPAAACGAKHKPAEKKLAKDAADCEKAAEPAPEAQPATASAAPLKAG